MSVGAQLQAARLERKSSLADVSEQTKIQPWVLEALESDRLQEMMSPVYVKGFLSTYARCLHLEPEKLISQLAWPQPTPAQASLPPASTPALKLQVSPALLRRIGIAAAACAVGIGVVALNPLARLPKLAWPKATRPAVAKAPSTGKPAAKAKPAAVAKKPQTGEQPKAAQARTASAPRSASETPAAPKLASVSLVNDPMNVSAAPAVPLATTQPLELVVTATRTTWVKVRADGKLLTQQRLQRGSNERWVASKQFEVIIAKPTQVELTLNGQPISPFLVAHGGRVLITRQGVKPLSDQR